MLRFLPEHFLFGIDHGQLTIDDRLRYLLFDQPALVITGSIIFSDFLGPGDSARKGQQWRWHRSNEVLLLDNPSTIKTKFTYPKAEHLKSRKAIEQLFKTGQSFFIYPYKVVYQLVSPEVRKSESPKEEPVSNQATSSSCTLTTSGLPDFRTSGLLSGFAVSAKNFKHAVDRNRIKRLGREAFRLNKEALTQQLTANNQQLQVFFIFTDKKLPDYKLIKPKMQACLKKLGWLARQTP